MPNLPKLAVAEHCPDDECAVPIGAKHRMGCRVAICVTTGQQRLIHETNPPDDRVDLPYTADQHVCGEDVWVGYPHGAVEAAAHGLFVRPSVPGDPTSGWIPCEPGTRGSVPDLHRVTSSGRWNPTRQVFELEAVRG